MNDLISRSRVISILNRLDEHSLTGKMDVTNAMYLIDQQPAAYDVDRVVAELEKSSKWVNETNEYGDDDGSDYISLSKAIEIVKQGGVAGGVCEWRVDKGGNYKCKAHAESYDSRVLDWNLCPYCGKKIKVVEQIEKLTDLKYEITKLDAKIENMRNRIEKMGLYEKTEVGIGFLTSTVEYFEKLREYLQTEEQGLLLRFPCKIGDTVWFIGDKCIKCEKDDCYGCPYRYGGDKKDEKFVYSMIVEQFSVQNDSIYLEDTDSVGSSSKTSINAKQLGKTVFLTKEEAEQKLKERV